MQDRSDPGGLETFDAAESRARTAVWLLAVVATAAIVTGLWYGQELLAPLALAGLIHTLVIASVKKLKTQTLLGQAIPGWAAYGLIVVALAVVSFVLGRTLVYQVSAISEAAPRYAARFDELTTQIGGALGPELMASLTTVIAEADVSTAVSEAAASASATFGMFSLVVVFVAFMLVDTGTLQQKLPHMLADPDRRAQVANALNAMSVGVQQYMWTKTVVSALTGAISYVFMKLAGLDFAETWAVLIFALNYIPTIGSIAGTVLPSLAALAQFENATPILVVLLGIAGVQFVIGNIVEPAMSSKGLNLSPFWMIFALTFWSMLWGIPGAFLSVPITVCLAIVFAQIPPLRPFGILLAGSVPEAAEKKVGGHRAAGS